MSVVAFDVNQNIMKPTTTVVSGGVRSPTSSATSTAASSQKQKLPAKLLNGLRRVGLQVETAEEIIPAPIQSTSKGETESVEDRACTVYRLKGSGTPSILIDMAGSRLAFNRYMEMDALLHQHRIRTLKVLAVNRKACQLLARNLHEDLPLMNGLKAETADRYLCSCLSVLDQLLNIPTSEIPAATPAHGCPNLDRTGLLNGMNLFVQWYLPLKNVELSAEEADRLAEMFLLIAESISGRPNCFTHGNFRRAQLTPRRGGGVVVSGFEYAVRGPVGYDLATLLIDRRLGLQRARAEHASTAFFRQAIRRRRFDDQLWTQRDFQQLIDYTALQISLTRLGEMARGLLIRGVRQPSVVDPVWAELVWYKRCIANLVASWPELHKYSEMFKQKFHQL